LGLPILQEDSHLTYGDKIVYPKNIETCQISEEKINHWANIAWIDLRKKQIEYWMKLVNLMYKEISDPKYKLINVERNFQKLNGVEDLGEVLAFLYSISGGNRKKL